MHKFENKLILPMRLFKLVPWIVLKSRPNEFILKYYMPHGTCKKWKEFLTHASLNFFYEGCINPNISQYIFNPDLLYSLLVFFNRERDTHTFGSSQPFLYGKIEWI
jgi:hypothetical protein